MSNFSVIYILGKGRSGSTLLNNCLGQAQSAVAVGELFHIWDWGFLENRPCGCGLPFLSCPFWGEVAERAFGSSETSGEKARGFQLQRRSEGWTNLPKLVLAGRRGRDNRSEIAEYAALLRKVYSAIHEASNAAVIVDSSKNPVSVAPMGLIQDLDVHLVHLVRNPNAVAYSWRKTQAWDDVSKVMMPRFSPAYTALSWLIRGLSAEYEVTSHRYPDGVSIRYEDFILAPAQVLSRILSLANRAPALDFIEGSEVTLAATHSIGGNPSRFETGRITLKADNDWTTRQSRFDKALVTTLTLPLLFRYGYWM